MAHLLRRLSAFRRCSKCTSSPIPNQPFAKLKIESIVTAANEEMTAKTRHLADVILTRDQSEENDSEHELKNVTRRRMALARAITLIESSATHQRRQADLLLNHLLAATRSSRAEMRSQSAPSAAGLSAPISSSSFRLGIAGPPGAGKSSLIETLGLYILDGGVAESEELGKAMSMAETPRQARPQESKLVHSSNESTKGSIAGPLFHPSKISVVCVDPSSAVTGGSILGDKTRMIELSRHERAYVRPSPTRGVLGGLAAYTSDVVSLCQSAGYELVIVETVGLGQSEVEIAESVDMLVLIVPPGGGDELQGVKKGIVEVADMLVVNKADGSLLPVARRTAADYRGALNFLRERIRGWKKPPVLLASAHTGEGVSTVWKEICRYRDVMLTNGELDAKRRRQSRYWMWRNVRELLSAKTKEDPALQEMAIRMERALDRGTLTPRVAASKLLHALMTNR